MTWYEIWFDIRWLWLWLWHMTLIPVCHFDISQDSHLFKTALLRHSIFWRLRGMNYEPFCDLSLQSYCPLHHETLRIQDLFFGRLVGWLMPCCKLNTKLPLPRADGYMSYHIRVLTLRCQGWVAGQANIENDSSTRGYRQRWHSLYHCSNPT